MRGEIHSTLFKLASYGQSVWLHCTQDRLLHSSEFSDLAERNNLSGLVLTQEALEEHAASPGAGGDLHKLMAPNSRAEDLCRRLTVMEAQAAADRFLPLYERTNRRDGFVSLEISPELAYDSEGMVEEARLLWEQAERPNLMIQVPATSEALPAVRDLVREGINVHVTLLFTLSRYWQVVEAYLSGLETRTARNLPVDGISSVAGFWLDRLDDAVDGALDRIERAGGPDARDANELRGRSAVATARLAYQMYRDVFHGDRFLRLAARGAKAQRLLWATACRTRDRERAAVRYLSELVGPATICALPFQALELCRHSATPAPTLQDNVAEAQHILASLSKLQVVPDFLAEELREEIIMERVIRYDRAVALLEGKRAEMFGS
jgi:transaldolase